MAYRDMRQFLDALERNGELLRIKKEVDWNLEIGGIVRRCNEEGYPAPLFEKVRGYPEGYRVVGGLMAGSSKAKPFRRFAIAMEMDPDTPQQELVDEFIKRMTNPIKPVIISTGPCKENIIKGNDVDLFKFPAPMIHGGDGGRYICSWHVNVNQDPVTGWVNWGMYRAHILTRTKLASQMNPHKHGAYIHFRRNEPENRHTPFAIAIGPEPISAFCGGTDFPIFANEADIAGGLRKEPVELVKCETNDLYVPATAEIVLEGRIMPHGRVEEGPHGEFTGYRVAEREPMALYRVDCVTHRNNPILSMSCMGMPLDECSITFSMGQSAALTHELRDIKGYPVRGVCVPPWAGSCAVFVSTKKPARYGQYLHRVASSIWACTQTTNIHYIIFVDDNVDPYDLHAVFHDMMYKCHPVKGIKKVEEGPGTVITPFLDYHDRHFNIGAAAIFDCTTPVDWPFPVINVNFNNPLMYPKELQDKIISSWGEYGYKAET